MSFMGTTSQAYFILLLAMASACDANLQVKTTATLGVSSDPVETATGRGMLGAESQDLRILIDKTITNAQDLDVKWDAGDEIDVAKGFELRVTSDDSCRQVIWSAQVNATELRVPELSEGKQYLCLSALTKSGAQVVAVNNALEIFIDRTDPVVNLGGTIHRNQTFSFSPSIIDALPTTLKWARQTGPGEVSFSHPYQSDSLLTMSQEGVYLLAVKVTDLAGNEAEATATVIWDVTPPSVDIGPDVLTGVMTDIGAISLSADAVSYHWTMESGPGTVIFSAPSTKDTQVSANAAGVYVLRLTAQDAAGNIGFDEMNLTWDPSVPTVNVGADRHANTSVFIDATTTLGASFAWSKVSGPGNLIFGTSNAEDTTISADMEGSYVVRLSVTNASGSWTINDELTFTWDTTPPQFASLSAVNAASDGYINQSEAGSNQPFLTLDATGHQTAAYTIPLDHSSPVTCDGGKTYDQTVLPVASSIPAVDNPYVVCVKLADAAGNISYGKSQVILKDTTSPSVNVGADRALNVTTNLDAVTSGAVTYAWSKESGSGTVTFGSQAAEDTTINASSDGTYVLRLTVIDAAGNVAFDEVAVTWDTVAPTFTSLSRINEASDGYINSSETGAGTPLWALVASGTTSTAFTLPLDETAPQSCDISKSYSQASIPTSLPALDNPYVICVRLDDAAGNVTYGKSQIVTRDTLAPTVNVGSDIVTNTTVNVNASSSDAVSWQWAKVSGGGTVTFGAPTAEDTSITVDTDGTYVIRLTVTDVAGNAGYDELSFTRNTVGPTMSSFNGANEATDGYVGAAETSSNAPMYTLVASSYQTATFTLPQDDSTPITCNAGKVYDQSTIPVISSIPAVDKPYVVCVKLVDSAANVTFGKSQVVIRDTQAPSVNVGLDQLKNATFSIDATTSGGSVFAWTMQSGVGTITFGTPAAEDTSVSASADGNYVLRLTVSDAAGNTAFDEVNVTWDTLSPVFTSLNGANEAANAYINAAETGSTNAAFTLSASDYDNVSYTAIFNDGAPQACDGTKTYALSSIPAINTMPGSDGVYAICAKLSDIAGNITYGKSQVITRDTVAPTVNIGGDVLTKNSVTIDATSVGASSYAWTKQSGSGAIAFGAPSAEDTSVSASADDTYVLRLTVADAAGNTAYDELNFAWDTTPPTVNVGADVTTNGMFSVNAVTTDATAFSWTKQSGVGTITFGTPTVEDTSVTASTEETFVLRLTATDAAGNSAYDELNFTWDVTPPNFTSLLGANEASDGYVNDGERLSSLAMFALTAANYATVSYSAILASSATCNGAQAYFPASIPSVNALPATDGSYVICAELSDAAGNITYGKSQAIVRDTVAPTVSVGADISTNTTYSIDATASDATTFAWTKQSGPGTVTFGSPSAEDSTVTVSSDGTYVLRLTVSDVAGNSAYDELTLVKDTVAPTFTSLLGANQASDGFLNSSEVASTATMLALVASDYATDDFSAVLDSSVTCDDGLVYGSADIPRINTVPSTDGSYAVCVKLTDAVGNVTYGKSQTVVRDTVAPTVDAGADATAGVTHNLDGTTSGAATFSWTKQGGPGVALFGNAALEDTTVSADTNGVYTLRLTVADAAGNTAYDEMSFTWDYNPVSVSVGSDLAKDELFTISPTVSGATTYSWSVTGGSASNITFGSPNAATTTVIASAAGTYVLRLTASDGAGHSSYDELTLTWSTDHHLIFATSALVHGNRGSLAAMDTECQTRAMFGGNPGHYVALASATGINAKDRVTITSVVKNSAQQLVAIDQADLWDGSLTNAVGYDETGASIGGVRNVWTGSDAFGVLSGSACSNWTSRSSGVTAKNGTTNGTNTDWNSVATALACNNTARLYCLSKYPLSPFTAWASEVGGYASFSYKLPPSIANINRIDVRQASGATPPADCASGTIVHSWTNAFAANGLFKISYLAGAGTFSYRACVLDASSQVIATYVAPESVTTKTGHVLFVTSTTYNANLGGVTGADNKCLARSVLLNLPGPFKALVSTSTVSAKDRVTISGPVKRTTGTVIASNAADLWDGTLGGTIYNEFGSNVDGAADVWTLTQNNGVTNSYDPTWECYDWTDGGAVNSDKPGSSGSTTQWMYQSSNTESCSTQNRIYCLSQ